MIIIVIITTIIIFFYLIIIIIIIYWPGPDRLLSMNFLFTKHIHHCSLIFIKESIIRTMDIY